MEVTGLEVYTVTYTYDERNRLITEIRTGDGRGASHFTYDNNGNLIRTDTTIWANDHNFFIEFETRTYNALNQLTRISRPGMTAEYTYRSDGLRFRRVVNGVWTYQIWNMGQVVLELNINLQAINRFYYAMAFNHRIRSLHHGFYIYNARGDVVQRTDNNGNLLHTYQYDAFGNEVPEPGAYQQYSNNPFRFGGEYWDWERGEYYLRARSYNPRFGRFTQPDPFWGVHNMQGSTAAIMQSANLYAFVMNNPGRWLDPLGLFAWNEADNRWFALRYEVEKAGGSVSWNARTGTATASIFGVDVNFTRGDDGVWMSNNRMFVRANTFYSAVVEAAGGEMIWLGGHGAFGGTFNAPHMYITINDYSNIS